MAQQSGTSVYRAPECRSTAANGRSASPWCVKRASSARSSSLTASCRSASTAYMATCASAEQHKRQNKGWMEHCCLEPCGNTWHSARTPGAARQDNAQSCTPVWQAADTRCCASTFHNRDLSVTRGKTSVQLSTPAGKHWLKCMSVAPRIWRCSVHCLNCAPDQPDTRAHVVVCTLHHALKQRHAWSLAYMYSGNSRVWPAAAMPTSCQTAAASFALNPKSQDAKRQGHSLAHLAPRAAVPPG